MSNPFGPQKEKQLLRLKWAAVKENVFLVSLSISWLREDVETGYSRFFCCESEAWRALREWSIATSVGYLVPKKMFPFLEEMFSSLRKEFLAEKRAFLKKTSAKEKEEISRSFIFEWAREDLTDSLASDRQREEIIREAFLRPRRILLEAIENAEKTGRRSLKEIIGKALIFNIVGDYLFTRYIERLEEAFNSKSAQRIKSAFTKIKEDFQDDLQDHLEPQREKSFQPHGGLKPLIVIHRYWG